MEESHGAAEADAHGEFAVRRHIHSAHRGPRAHPRPDLERVCRASFQRHRFRVHEGVLDTLLHLCHAPDEAPLHLGRFDAMHRPWDHPYPLGDPVGFGAVVLDRHRHDALGGRGSHDCVEGDEV